MAWEIISAQLLKQQLGIEDGMRVLQVELEKALEEGGVPTAGLGPVNPAQGDKCFPS